MSRRQAKVAQDQQSGPIAQPYGPGEGLYPVTGTTDHPEYYNGGDLSQELPTGFAESLGATSASAWAENPATQLYNNLQDEAKALQDERSGSQLLTPDELNKLYPGIEKPFTDPTYADVAQAIAERARARQEMARVISNGPQNIFAKSARGVLGFATGLTDPINLLAFEGTAGLGTELGGFENFGQNFSRLALAGTIPQAVSAYTSIEDQRDYSAGWGFLNILGTSAAFAGLHAAFGKTPGVEKAARETAMAQALTDRPVNVEPVVKTRLSELQPPEDAATVVPDRLPAQPNGVPLGAFKPSSEGVGIGQLPLYEGRPAGVSSSVPIGADLGEGLYLTDNPHVANAAAVSRFDETPGRMTELRFTKQTPRLVNLDEPFSEGAQKALGPIAADVYGAKITASLEGKTAREVLADLRKAEALGQIPEGSQTVINQALSERGFDGYTGIQQPEPGQVGASHRFFMLFDPKNTGTAGGALERVTNILPDARGLPPTDRAGLEDATQAQATPAGERTFSEKTATELHQETSNPKPAVATPQDEEKIVVAAMDKLSGLKDQGSITEAEFQRATETLKELDANLREEETAIKAAMFCVGKEL